MSTHIELHTLSMKAMKYAKQLTIVQLISHEPMMLDMSLPHTLTTGSIDLLCNIIIVWLPVSFSCGVLQLLDNS